MLFATIVLVVVGGILVAVGLSPDVASLVTRICQFPLAIGLVFLSTGGDYDSRATIRLLKSRLSPWKLRELEDRYFEDK